VLRDEIPLNTVFAAPVTGGGMEALYHIAGDEPHDYVTALPRDLSTIDAAAFFFAGDYAPGKSSDPAFEVSLNTALGDVTVENTARVSVSPDLSVASNETVHQRDTDAEASLRFVDPVTGDDMTSGEPGKDTRLALFAGACNSTAAIDKIEITLVSRRTGDSETVTETGANTGIFTTADVVLAEMVAVRAGDGVMATTKGDEILAFADCGAGRISDTLPVVPGNFLFNSVTNAPIEGVAVTLIDAETGALKGMTVTDRQGFFALPPVSEGAYAYRLVGADGWTYPSVRADFPGYGRLVTEAGFGESFAHEGGTPAPSDIPADPYYAVPLSLAEQAERDQVGTGEILTYTLTLTNNMYQAIMYTRLLDDLPRLARRLRRQPDDLVLVSRRHLRSNNSWLHNVGALMKGRDRCTLLMHRDDAARLGLHDGDLVAVTSAGGRIDVPLEVTEAIKPGVVSMPHGWGHGKQGTRLTVANGSPGVNTNILSPPDFLDEPSGNGALNGIPVTVTRAGH
jgi:hypothetical protein